MSTTLNVHPSAHIAKSAELGEGCVVGPFVVLEEGVQVGANTVLGVGTILHKGSVVGANCRLGPYAVIGGEPMDTAFRGEASFAVLEDSVTLREFATVHRASGEGAETRIGRDTLVMSYVHISHNVQVGRACVLTTQVQLGGHAQVGDYAVLGSTAILHQHCRVGPYAMFGAGSASNGDILPYSMARGNPARHYRLNRIGLQRRGFSGERYGLLEKAIRAFRHREYAQLTELARLSADVELMLTFKMSSRRGLCTFV
jgi:UDP-N-acetylglucosamine acyltransferase